MAATDDRAELVTARFLDNQSLHNYALGMMNDLGEALSFGESIKIPSVTTTVQADGATRVDLANLVAPAKSKIDLVVNMEPWVPHLVPRLDQATGLRGGYWNGVADASVADLKAYVDSGLLDTYLAGEITWAASGATTYRDNVAGDTLVADDFLLARGKMLRQKGTNLSNLLWILDPLAEAVIMGFTGWRPVESSSTYGPFVVGILFGIPVITSQAVRIAKEHPIATAALNSNILTLTFAANPRLSAGQRVTTTGLTTGYNLTSPTALSTVASNGLTVTAPLTNTNAADVLGGGANTLIEESSHNLLVDRSRVFKAEKYVPFVRFMEDPGTSGDIMQTITLLGYVAQVGRVRSVIGPKT